MFDKLGRQARSAAAAGHAANAKIAKSVSAIGVFIVRLHYVRAFRLEAMCARGWPGALKEGEPTSTIRRRSPAHRIKIAPALAIVLFIFFAKTVVRRDHALYLDRHHGKKR
jgi:hypothetical protein